MKTLTLILTFLGFNATAICTLDAYVREHKSFDGDQVSLTFAMGKELRELGSSSYKDDVLYAYHVVNNQDIWYEIINPHNCGLATYENCINEMPSMLDAVDMNGKQFKIIVYK